MHRGDGLLGDQQSLSRNDLRGEHVRNCEYAAGHVVSGRDLQREWPVLGVRECCGLPAIHERMPARCVLVWRCLWLFAGRRGKRMRSRE